MPNGVNGVNGAVRGFPPAAKVLMNGDVPMSPEMKAAGALKRWCDAGRRARAEGGLARDRSGAPAGRAIIF